MLKKSIALLSLTTLILSGCDANPLATDMKETKFTVTIENLTDKADLKSTFAPGVWAVHSKDQMIFTPGEKDAGKGLKELAEDGKNEKLAESLKGMDGISSAKTDGIEAGKSISFSFTAKEGQVLSFATMLVASNDGFWAPSEALPLWDEDGKAMSGDVDITGKISLWDAGTEKNEEPGKGNNQPPNEGGDAEDSVVQLMSAAGDGFSYPQARDAMKVTITSEEVTMSKDEMDNHDHDEMKKDEMSKEEETK